MIDVLATWTVRRIEVFADSAYCNDTVMRGMPVRVHLFGSMRSDAVLTALPDRRKASARGRPSKRGKLLPKPEAIANDEGRPWQTCEAFVYGRKTIRYKTLCAQWYRACGTRQSGIPTTFPSTDQGRSPAEVDGTHLNAPYAIEVA